MGNIWAENFVSNAFLIKWKLYIFFHLENGLYIVPHLENAYFDN